MSDPGLPAPARSPKSAAAFRTIGEAADELDVPAHVLRFWETRFPQLRPVKRSGGRRYYRPEDIELLRRIRHWLYRDGYTIRGVQQLLENQPSRSSTADTDPDITAEPETDAEAVLTADITSEAEADAANLSPASGLQTLGRSGLDRDADTLDPTTRAELEAIRRELLQARALLDEVLRQPKTS